MRYFLFGGNEIFYASGGANDFLGAGDSIDDLSNSDILKYKEEYEEESIEWWHIFDAVEKKIVAGTKIQAYGADNLSDDLVIK